MKKGLFIFDKNIFLSSYMQFEKPNKVIFYLPIKVNTLIKGDSYIKYFKRLINIPSRRQLVV